MGLYWQRKVGLAYFARMPRRYFTYRGLGIHVNCEGALFGLGVRTPTSFVAFRVIGTRDQGKTDDITQFFQPYKCDVSTIWNFCVVSTITP